MRRNHKRVANKNPREGGQMIIGYRAVFEALRAGKRQGTIFATNESLPRIEPSLAAKPQDSLALRIVSRGEINRLVGHLDHQDLLIQCSKDQNSSLESLAQSARLIIALDKVTDIHNLGAIMRGSAAYNADGLLLTERDAPGINGMVTKIASGAAEYLPVVRVVNLARSLDYLKDHGFFLVGFSEEGKSSINDIDLGSPLLLAFGSESHGLRRLTRERCDINVALDTPGMIKSLNVSVSVAVALALIHQRKN